MSPQIDWHDNPELEQWEAVIGPFHAVARFDAHSGRYVAFLEDNTTRGTDHYAPASYSDPWAARAWCEAEAARLLAERASRQIDPDSAIKRRIDDEL